MVKNFFNTKKIGLSCGIFIAVFLVFVACNKPFPDTLKNEFNNDSSGFPNLQQKVLFIVIDGARGEALRTVAPPNLTLIADNAIYTGNGLADFERQGQPLSDENAWANLLTGVTQTKHKVTTNDFSGHDFATYPSLFTRLKSAKPGLRTAAFTTSASLKTNLLADATVSQALADDAAVKEAAVNELKNGEAGIVLAHFNSVKAAGDQYGYGNDVTEYVNSIRTVDEYVGALKNEITKRSGYANENWLIVVTSSKGGNIPAPPVDITAYGDRLRNTFIFFYFPRFKGTLLEKPADSRGAGTFRGTYANLYGIPGNATIPGVNAVVQNSTAGGPAAGPYVPTALDAVNAYTVEAKVKIFRGSNNAHPAGNIPFFSKTPMRSNSGNNSGWAFRTGGSGEIYLWFRSDNPNTASRKGIEFRVGVISDNNWHTLAATFIKSGNSITGTAYLDGFASGTATLTDLAPGEGLVAASPIKLGFNDNAFVANGNVNTAFADVRVWNDALPANIIYQYSCLPGLPPVTHPFRNKLVGFWSCTVGSGSNNTIVDETANGRDILLSGNGEIQWKSFAELNPNICPEPESAFFRKVPNSVDIPFQIYRWLGINITSTWDLDGKIWITSYEGL